MLLIASRTGTAWFHDFCWNFNHERPGVEIRPTKGRIKFIHPDDSSKKSPPMGSLIIIFRPPPGGTFTAAKIEIPKDISKVNLPHPNKLYTALTDFTFPGKP